MELLKSSIKRVRRRLSNFLIVEGGSSGTTYRLMEATTVLDTRPESLHAAPRPKIFSTRTPDIPNPKKTSKPEPKKPPKGEKLTYAERETYIDEIMMRYREDRRVKLALHNYQDRSKSTEFNGNPFVQYTYEIIKYPLLTAADEQVLFGTLDQGLKFYSQIDKDNISADQEKILVELAITYNKIYHSNLRLVVHGVKKQISSDKATADALDYVQEGNMALDVAIKRFEIDKGYKFSTYAMWWIRQKIQRSYAQYSRTIYIPQKAHEEWVNANRTEDELTEELKRRPTLAELAQALNRAPEQVANIFRFGAQNLISLDERLGPDGYVDIGDTVASSSDNDLHEKLNDREMLEAIIQKTDLSQEELLHLSIRFHIFIDSLSGTKLRTIKGLKPYEDVFRSINSDKLMPFKEMQQLVGLSEGYLRNTDRILLQKIISNLSDTEF